MNPFEPSQAEKHGEYGGKGDISDADSLSFVEGADAATADEQPPQWDNSGHSDGHNGGGNSGGDTQWSNVICRSTHPIVAALHVIGKVIPLLVYFLSGDNFVLSFILCVIFLALDFWFVKNIAGRLLVGLRWWNALLPNGRNEWRYEARPASVTIPKANASVFWACIYVTPLCWIAAGIIASFRFNVQWLLICVVALVMGVANAVGYIRCLRAARAKGRTPDAAGNDFISSIGDRASKSLLQSAAGSLPALGSFMLSAIPGASNSRSRSGNGRSRSDLLSPGTATAAPAPAFTGNLEEEVEKDAAVTAAAAQQHRAGGVGVEGNDNV